MGIPSFYQGHYRYHGQDINHGRGRYLEIKKMGRSAAHCFNRKPNADTSDAAHECHAAAAPLNLNPSQPLPQIPHQKIDKTPHLGRGQAAFAVEYMYR